MCTQTFELMSLFSYEEGSRAARGRIVPPGEKKPCGRRGQKKQAEAWQWRMQGRRMEDGRWKMEDGGWKVEDEGWAMEDGGWKMEDGG